MTDKTYHPGAQGLKRLNDSNPTVSDLSADHAAADPILTDNLIDEDAFEKITTGALVSRSMFGGVLMGLANLVPGISGGTMLLAAGIYPRFIDAVANVTRCRFRFQSMLLLACVVGSAGLSILLLAGTLKNLVVDHRWIMYSLFIGLTLGGLPVVWKLARPASTRLVVSALAAFAVMVCLAILKATGAVGHNESNFLMLFVAGLTGASAMILPGVSGGYLLLLLGQYVPILAGIDDFKMALKARDIGGLVDSTMSVVLPVGVGVVVGVVLVGNLLQWLLHHYRKATLGALIGLLLGSTVGLWPFQSPLPPQVGDTIKGQIVTVDSIAEIEPDDWQTTHFQPSVPQLAGSLAISALGFAATLGIARIGGDDDS